MSLETLRTTWRRVAPYVAGLAVLGSIGFAYAGGHRSCCGPGSPCCHAGAPCCHGHAPPDT